MEQQLSKGGQGHEVEAKAEVVAVAEVVLLTAPIQSARVIMPDTNQEAEVGVVVEEAIHVETGTKTRVECEVEAEQEAEVEVERKIAGGRVTGLIGEIEAGVRAETEAVIGDNDMTNLMILKRVKRKSSE